MTQTIFELKSGSFVFEKKNALAGDVCAEMINRFEKNPMINTQGVSASRPHEKPK